MRKWLLKHRAAGIAALLAGTGSFYLGTLDDEIVQLTCVASDSLHGWSWLALIFLYPAHLILVPVGIVMLIVMPLDLRQFEGFATQIGPVLVWLSVPVFGLAAIYLFILSHYAVGAIALALFVSWAYGKFVVQPKLEGRGQAELTSAVPTKPALETSGNTFQGDLATTKPQNTLASFFMAIILAVSGAGSLYVLTPQLEKTYGNGTAHSLCEKST